MTEKVALHLWSMKKQIISLLQSLVTRNLKIGLFKLMGLEQSSWFVIHTWSQMKSMDLISLLTENGWWGQYCGCQKRKLLRREEIAHLQAGGLCYQFDYMSSCLPRHMQYFFRFLPPSPCRDIACSSDPLCNACKIWLLCHHTRQRKLTSSMFCWFTLKNVCYLNTRKLPRNKKQSGF